VRRVNIFLGGIIYFFNFQHKKIIFFLFRVFFCIFSKDLSSPSTKEPFSQKKGDWPYYFHSKTKKNNNFYFFFEKKKLFSDNFASFHFHTWLTRDKACGQIFLFSSFFCWDNGCNHTCKKIFLGVDNENFWKFSKNLLFILLLLLHGCSYLSSRSHCKTMEFTLEFLFF
jgi:hypothetical protein